MREALALPNKPLERPGMTRPNKGDRASAGRSALSRSAHCAMKQATRIGRAATRALPPAIFAGVGFFAFGAFDVMRRGTPPVVMAVVCLGLTAVVFVTYFLLGIAGHRVSRDGTVRAPWPYAWAFVLAAVLMAGAIAYLVIRELPGPSYASTCTAMTSVGPNGDRS